MHPQLPKPPENNKTAKDLSFEKKGNKKRKKLFFKLRFTDERINCIN